jgi:aminoglycoside 3-N-acetyltransferase I
MNIVCRRVSRLEPETARNLFDTLAEVFGEGGERVGDAHLDALLRRNDFIAIAAFAGAEMIGGLTAYVLPMSESECPEVFIYDVAVKLEYRRNGAGAALFATLLKEISSLGAQSVFVQVDNDDGHALEFYRSLGGLARTTTEFTWRPTR